MRGFVFTVDALFAAVACITIALSFYLIIDSMNGENARNKAEHDILAVLDKSGRFGSVSGAELEAMLSPYNKCGRLTLSKGGVEVRGVQACACDSEERYSARRSFVSPEGGAFEYYVAHLRTCLKG